MEGLKDACLAVSCSSCLLVETGDENIIVMLCVTMQYPKIWVSACQMSKDAADTLYNCQHSTVHRGQKVGWTAVACYAYSLARET